MAFVLLDTCVWGGVLPALSHLGHTVEWSGNWEEDPGELAILKAAHTQHGILVTLDKDFGELAILKAIPHSGIVRLNGFRSTQMAGVIDHLLRTYLTELSAGALITATPERIRIRLP
jgi:predicted nuclease of predicted toxin-antitoxin system